MPNPIVHGFSNLLRFGGRDARRVFWPYAAVVLGIYMGLGPIVLSLVMAPAMTAMLERPETMQQVMPPFFIVSGLLFLAVVFLYAAAVARRLRDSGRSPIWGLVPLPFVTFSMIAFIQVFSSGEITRFFPFVMISNSLYLVSIGALIVLLAMPSRPPDAT